MKHILPYAGQDKVKEGKPLQPTSTPPPVNLIRQTWLQYFNDYLRDRGIISEDEWRKMRRLIGGI